MTAASLWKLVRSLSRTSGKLGTRDLIQHLESRQLLSAAPTGLTATTETTGIALAWNSSVAASYNVYRGDYGTGESTTPLATNVTTISFLDPTTDLVTGNEYYYTVTAVTGGVQSAASNEAHTYADGAFQDPTVNFNTGFPAKSAEDFTSTGNVFNSDSTISVGGTLQYNTPVNARQFNVQFEFTQPNTGSALDLSFVLQSPNGTQYKIFDGNAVGEQFASNFGIFPGDQYQIQFSYSEDVPNAGQDQVEGYAFDTTKGNGTSFGDNLNIPALLGSDTALVEFTSDVSGQYAKLENMFYANSQILPQSDPVVTESSAGINLQFSNVYLGEDSGANFGGPTEVRIFRGTSPGGEGITPIAMLPIQGNGESYLDKTAVPGVTYYYVADGGAGASTNEFSATIPATQVTTQLTGTPIGTTATWDGTGTIAKVFDGNLNTFFDPANGNLTNWVGLDLGKTSTITQIKYAPRAGYEFRMLDGQFQVSNTPDFSTGVQTLYTITTTPVAGQLTTIDVNSVTGFRYIRYTGGLQWVNIAEMQVFGYQAPPAISLQTFAGNPIGAGGAWYTGTGVAAASDGNLSSYFDPANGSLSNWAGLDLVTPVTITQISYAPRPGYEFRMLGGLFQVSSTPDFSSDVHTLYTITEKTVAGMLTTVTVPAVGAYRYVRYTGGNQWVNIAEMHFAGPVTPVSLTGTVIGSGGAWNQQSTYSAAFDGNLSTFFDPANGSLTNWVGEDLGFAQAVTQIKFAPRAGYEFRMVGGMFQASNTADFSSGVITLATISSSPTAGQVTTINVNPGHTAYRYYRYIGGMQWVNIGEMELDG
jgi:hypothetical protein